MSEAEGRPRVPWRGRDALVVVVVTVVLVFVAALFLPGISLPVLLLIQTGVFGGVTLLWAHRHRRVGALLGRRFRVGPGPVLGALGAAGTSLVLQIVFAVAVVSLAGGEVPEGGGSLPPSLFRQAPAVIVVAAVILAPLSEELFFRGLLLQGLWRSFGRWPALAVSSALFGLAHVGVTLLGSVLSVGTAIVVGVVLGWAFIRSENLAVPLFAHGTINAVALLLQASLGA